MNRLLKAALPSLAAALFASGASAGSSDDYNVSLCQQAVKAQIKLEHDKANVEFGDKKVNATSSGASQVDVSGKGHFTRHDGTKKHFNYTCTVDTSAGRVVNASFNKTD
jgi:hypothetical protein